MECTVELVTWVARSYGCQSQDCKYLSPFQVIVTILQLELKVKCRKKSGVCIAEGVCNKTKLDKQSEALDSSRYHFLPHINKFQPDTKY